MQRVLFILSITPELKDKLIERLEHDRFDPSYLSDINYMPSNRIDISLKISINAKSMLNIAKNIFMNFDAMIVEGPVDIEPGFKIKFKQHVSRIWKETLMLLIEGVVAAHAVAGFIILYNNLKLEEIHFPYIEVFAIGSVAAAIYFISSYRKYQKISED